MLMQSSCQGYNILKKPTNCLSDLAMPHILTKGDRHPSSSTYILNFLEMLSQCSSFDFVGHFDFVCFVTVLLESHANAHRYTQYTVLPIILNQSTIKSKIVYEL